MKPEDFFDEIKGKGAGIKMTKQIKTVLIIAAVVIALMMANPFVKVGAGERGVVLNFGAVQDKILDEGLHLRIPVMQQVILMDVKVQKSQTDASAASEDIQETRSTIALNYHVQQDKVNWVYQNIGIQFKERLIDPAVQEVVKAVTARYSAVDLITKRDTVREEIKALMKERLIAYGIIVDDFAIVDFQFSAQFAQAIESKQTAEQFALKAKRDLDRIKIEGEQKIVSAKAEAESLRLQKMNVSSDLIKLRQIEATMKAIEKWDGQLPKVTSGAVPFIDVKSFD
ncbi:MAG: prohibitin family protein [Thermodesulfovibrionales bacterium]|nr:prohibitin family protein [Thermodesulfovibrionales bacterium]